MRLFRGMAGPVRGLCGCCEACKQREQLKVPSPGRGAAAGRGIHLRAAGGFRKTKSPRSQKQEQGLGFKIRQDEGFRTLARRANVNEESRAGTAGRT